MTGPGAAVFDWLYEGRPAVYVVLGAALAVLLVAWKQTPRRAYLRAAAALLALIGLYYLLDRQVETEREQVVRKIREMVAAVQTRDADRIFANVSDTFRLQTADRGEFRKAVEGVLRDRLVNEVEAWGFAFPDKPEGKGGDPGVKQGVARVEFLAKPKGGVADNHTYYLVRARMIRDPDGQWRLQSFQVFNPYSDSDNPLAVPHLPN